MLMIGSRPGFLRDAVLGRVARITSVTPMLGGSVDKRLLQVSDASDHHHLQVPLLSPDFYHLTQTNCTLLLTSCFNGRRYLRAKRCLTLSLDFQHSLQRIFAEVLGITVITQYRDTSYMIVLRTSILARENLSDFTLETRAAKFFLQLINRLSQASCKVNARKTANALVGRSYLV